MITEIQTIQTTSTSSIRFLLSTMCPQTKYSHLASFLRLIVRFLGFPNPSTFQFIFMSVIRRRWRSGGAHAFVQAGRDFAACTASQSTPLTAPCRKESWSWSGEVYPTEVCNSCYLTICFAISKLSLSESSQTRTSTALSHNLSGSFGRIYLLIHMFELWFYGFIVTFHHTSLFVNPC